MVLFDVRHSSLRQHSGATLAATFRAAQCIKRRVLDLQPTCRVLLCTTMKAEDVTDTLNMALKASGLDQVYIGHRTRLLSDNGWSYISGDLATWLKDHKI